MKWFVRIAQVLLSAVLLMSGLMKVFVSSEEIRTLYTETLGYNVGFMRIVGVAESLAAIGLIVGFRWPRLTLLSSSVLAIIMAGATVSTLVSGQGAATAGVPFVLLILALVLLFKNRPAANSKH
ncbi:DoxX family protein [Paenibacillus ginsengarvi]|uniref:DoxX family protein n=1 Tax=Paenibacillus ginsengarvi TaxID=400777 RepID=A0A3B0CIC4_9BACL|nr:DoxX family protein [Paenibacillus ginsengarvi]RKN85123.1 DoxX family protein [Paenibacillus ginsengarvi]